MYCGAAFAPPVQCPGCGRSLAAEARKCSYCNRALGTAPAPTGPNASQRARAADVLLEAERQRRSGALGAAMALFDQALATDPSSIGAWIGRGKVFAAEKRFDLAAMCAVSAAKLDPTHAEARQLVELWQRQVQAPTALGMQVAMQQAVDELTHARQLLDAGRAPEALGLIEHRVADVPPSMQTEPGLVALFVLHGIALRQLRRYDDALVALDRALRCNDRYALAWQNRADVLDELGRAGDALHDIERAVALDPGHANAWVDRGYYLRKHGRHEDALESYKRALSINPMHPEALNNLANVLAYLQES